MSRLTKEKPPIIYGDGAQTRDFIHVKDVVEANMRCLESTNLSGGVFNVGTGIPTTINHLAEVLSKLMHHSELKPTYSKPRKGDIQRSYADTSLAHKVLGFGAKITLDEGLGSLVAEAS